MAKQIHKVTCFHYLLMFVAFLTSSSYAQTWTSVADIGGSGREECASFSVNGLGYVVAGSGGDNEVWEYTPATDAWAQKSPIGGSFSRFAPASFCIGTKCYVFGGWEGLNALDDLWEYDIPTDTWTAKASLPFSGLAGAYGFAINGKGYIVGGFDGQFVYARVWEYDPATDQWSPKIDFGGGPVTDATGFSINGEVYVGTGSANNTGKTSFWKYNPASDTWTQRADFGGSARSSAIGFAVNGRGYIGLGRNRVLNEVYDDIWAYDPTSDSWTQHSTLDARHGASSFAIGNNAYVGLGVDFTAPVAPYRDFYRYSFSGGPTGIETQHHTSGMRVYPNPATDQVFITLQGASGTEMQLSLWDLSGRQIHVQQTSSVPAILSLEQVPAGTYILRIETGERTLVQRLIRN